MFCNLCGHKRRPAKLCAKGPGMNISIGNRSSWLVGVAILLVLGATSQGTVAPTDENRKPPQATVLRGTIARAPSKGVTLNLNKDRQATVAGADGSFSFSVQLQEPTYA